MCTSIRFTDTAGNMFFGRNLDWGFSYGQEVLIVPSGYDGQWACGADVPGTQRQNVIGMGLILEGKPCFFDCANESGLAVAGLNFPGFAKYADKPIEGKTNVASYEFPYWVAANFKTVDEVENAIQDLAIVGLEIGKYPPSLLHWMIADKDRSIVVEYMDSGLHIHHNDVDTLTNQPQFDWHRENLRNYMNLTPDVPSDVEWRDQKLDAYGSGFGMLGLPGAFNSPSRFVRAAYLNAHYPQKETEQDNVARLFHTLLGASMVEGGAKMDNGQFEMTIYTGGYSAATKTYYWNTYEDLGFNHVCMTDYDLSGKEIIQSK